MIERKEMPTKLAGSVSGHVHCASHAKTDSHTIFTHTYIHLYMEVFCVRTGVAVRQSSPQC